MLVTLTFDVYDDEYDIHAEYISIVDISRITYEARVAHLHFGVSAKDVKLIQIAPYVEADDPYANLDDYEVPF